MNIHELRLADDKDRGAAYAAFARLIADEKLAAGVAVGVRFGGVAEAILQHESVDELLGVDAYDRADAATDPAGLTNEQFENLFWYAMGRLSRFGPRYNHVRGSSTQGAQILNVELDFVFLDAFASKQAVDDVKAWFPKVRKGGIIGGIATGQTLAAIVRFFAATGTARSGDGNLWWVRRDV